LVKKAWENQQNTIIYGIGSIWFILLNRITDKIIVVSPPNGSYLFTGRRKRKKQEKETDAETLKRESVEELGFR